MNENQGAESTLSFLLAVAEMRAADRLALQLVVAAGSTLASTGVAKVRPDRIAVVPVAKESSL